MSVAPAAPTRNLWKLTFSKLKDFVLKITWVDIVATVLKGKKTEAQAFKKDCRRLHEQRQRQALGTSLIPTPGFFVHLCGLCAQERPMD